MSLSEWLNTRRNSHTKQTFHKTNLKVPEGLWVKCDQCGLLMYYKTLNNNLKVCLKCSHHFPTSSQDRITTTGARRNKLLSSVCTRGMWCSC